MKFSLIIETIWNQFLPCFSDCKYIKMEKFETLENINRATAKLKTDQQRN